MGHRQRRDAMNHAMRFLAAALAIGMAWARPLSASARENKEVGLTIYSSADPRGFDPQRFIAQQRTGYEPEFAWQVPGFAVIRDTRELDLKQGPNVVSFTDVAQFIDPTTVSLADLSIPAHQPDEQGIKVVQQTFQFDLISPRKLLDKYLDQDVTVNVNHGDGKVESVTGKLLSSTQSQLVLETAQGLRLLNQSADIQLGKLPEGLITKPTLQWWLWAPAAGKRTVRTAYQTDGITWRADYNLVLNRDDTKADLGAWVTILNFSGASYPNARLKLIAGDVQRIQPEQRYGYEVYQIREAYKSAAAPVGFQERAFFEYHLYDLPHPTTIDQNSTQQIALFPTVRDISVEKVLVYSGLPGVGYQVFPNPQTDRDIDIGQQSNKKVDVYLRFDNKEANKLGIPLPRGKVRVFKQDVAEDTAKASGNGTLEFVGEDVIDHTAKNEKVLVKIGQAFDVTGERVQTDFMVDSDGHRMDETISITLRNAKDKPQKVIVRETLYRWTNWRLVKTTDPYEKVDSRTIHFEVEVPAEGEKTLDYTVKYTW